MELKDYTTEELKAELKKRNVDSITNNFKLVQTIIKSIKNESINTTRPRLIQQGCRRSKTNRE